MSIPNNVIVLSLARNYVSSWGTAEALRELIANAVDTGDYNIYIGEDTLYITTQVGAIPREYLLLGGGSKSENTDTIGQFNEGLKLALLILTREGYDLQIENGDVSWDCYFDYSPQFKTQCLHIREDPLDAYESSDTVHFFISGLPEDILEEVQQKHLIFDEERSVHETPYGEILLDEKYKGHIYCGGIWVTHDEEFEYGYNFNTDCLKLDRDRKTVRTFDIQWETKNMWAYISKDPDEEQAGSLINCISNKKSDVSFLYSETSKVSPKVSDKMLEDFKEEHGEDAVITDDYDESLKLKESGYKKVVFTDNKVLAKTVRSSTNYQTITFAIKEKPMDILIDFHEKWCDNMDSDMDNAYSEMLEKLEKLI